MAPERAKKDFISFILAAEKDKKLTEEFFSKKNATDLHKFFQKEGFTEIEPKHCKDILKAKTVKYGASRWAAGINSPCPPNTNY
jgi:hypothetical protein